MTKIYLQWYCYDRRSPPRQPFFCEWSTSQLISRSIAKLSKQYISSPSLYTKKGSPFDIPVPSSFLTKLRWIYVRTDGNRTLTLLLLLNTVIDPWNPWKYSEQIVENKTKSNCGFPYDKILKLAVRTKHHKYSQLRVEVQFFTKKLGYLDV